MHENEVLTTKKRRNGTCVKHVEKRKDSNGMHHMNNVQEFQGLGFWPSTACCGIQGCCAAGVQQSDDLTGKCTGKMFTRPTDLQLARSKLMSAVQRDRCCTDARVFILLPERFRVLRTGSPDRPLTCSM